MKTPILLTVMLTCLIFSSCSKPQQKEPPPPLPKTFAFTDTNTVIAASEIESPENDKNSLKADFNQDGLSDLAIIKKEGENQNKVDIYIRMKPETAAAAGSESPLASAEARYFKGGTIQRPLEGRIIGIASAAEGKVVNIVILVSHTNQPNEWIQYRNDGGSFTEVTP